MKLDNLCAGLGTDFDELRCLLREADAAFYSDDRARCLDAVEQLYAAFDEEFGRA